MTRKERREAADAARVKQELEWLTELQELSDKGLKFKEIVEELAERVALKMEKEPQRKASMLAAWLDFTTKLKAAVRAEAYRSAQHDTLVANTPDPESSKEIFYAYNDTFKTYHELPLAGARAQQFVDNRNKEKGGKWSLHTREQYAAWRKAKGEHLDFIKETAK